MINVVRSDVLQGFVRAIRRKSFDPRKKLNVLFVDMNNVTEGAVDNGGPLREFFRLLLAQVFNSSIFEGPAVMKHLALSTSGLYTK